MDGLEPTFQACRHSIAFFMLILNFKMVAQEPCLHIEARHTEPQDHCENRGCR